ncbi:hypothetical protein TL16_g06121 [Triparma laevis f. inornata]|uniref:Uncharacterized protein n=2 Tax=Triparma laevis TaxID=1534972 RepID=A0A9W7KS94_9STRA|nr:hypothetical protein TL16_g06121 [Triparma laevis f. inornata]GMI09739.1 hypothetical protein TrLO_g5314 [Triparma laevis f. longispina]
MSVSIIGGKLAPSMKYKPERSFEMNQTQWRSGVDEIQYVSTYQLSNSRAGDTEGSVPFPKLDKNASDSRAIFGDANVPSAQHFQTENRIQFCSDYSVQSSIYEKQKPAEGFDRETSNQTNYELGLPGEQGEWKSSTHALQMARESNEPLGAAAIDQPNIGGWMTGPGGSYFKDIETYKNIERGGGGGEGNLGLEFNILTNQHDSKARGNILARTGARLSQDRASNHQRFPSGKPREEIDIITGKPKVMYQAPTAETAESLRRPAMPILSTRPW